MGWQERTNRITSPGVERVESRHLLSALLAFESRPPLPPGFVTNLAASHAHAPGPNLGTLAPAASGGVAGGGGGHGGGSNGGGSGFGGATASPPAPVVPGQGTPTARELARERFHAAFSGPFSTGPGRFSDQAKILHFRGLGGSNFFLHGDFQMAIVAPTDPAAATVGAAILEDKNNNSSGIIGLDLIADPNSLDARGRPTSLSFANDPSIYSGIFFFDSASGTVTIKYHGNAATVVFQGHVYTNGLTSPLANSDLYSRGGRTHNR